MYLWVNFSKHEKVGLDHNVGHFLQISLVEIASLSLGSGTPPGVQVRGKRQVSQNLSRKDWPKICPPLRLYFNRSQDEFIGERTLSDIRCSANWMKGRDDYIIYWVTNIMYSMVA